MGCVSSRYSTVGYEESKKIDLQLKKYSKEYFTQVKMLLLGPGESGKSTVFKQMKIIQDNGGFTREELMNFRPIVFSNCVSQMRCLVKATATLQISYETITAFNCASDLISLTQQNWNWSEDIAQIISTLWQDGAIKKACLQRGSRFHLNDTADYFFDNVSRFAKEDYVPTVADALRTRVRSTGIEEAEFVMDNHTFRLVDVGGQRSERRKWIHCFDSVTAVLFCASLSGYDEVLREDNSQNRMTEALLLFHEVVHSSWLKEPAIILFLNKADIFEKKIKRVPIKVLFEDYTGAEKDLDSSKDFIMKQFLVRSDTRERVYAHFTCALNTENIEFVIRSTNDMFIKGTLKTIGIF